MEYIPNPNEITKTRKQIANLETYLMELEREITVQTERI